jgi:hypothetical protein
MNNNSNVGLSILTTAGATRQNVTKTGLTGQQTGVFNTGGETISVGMKTRKDASYMDGAQESISLEKFLARPVQLTIGAANTYDWSIGAGTVGTNNFTLDPWTWWQNNPAVKEKLKNFAYLQGDLKVKFVVAGTPFHYGLIQVSYLPYYSGDSIFNQQLILLPELGATAGESTLMTNSTRLKIELDANTSDSVEIVCPFVYHKNWIDIPSITTLGTLYASELVPLTKASDTAVSVIQVTIFAWMENAVISTPTILAATSGKEQPADASVSAIASAVADAAGKLTNVPILGPAAKATAMVSGAVGRVASLLGFSRPIEIGPVQPIMQRSVNSMALTQGLSTAHKLTMDPRQELTISPASVGLGDVDEMSIENIVSRECFLTTVKWNDSGGIITTPAGLSHLLFTANVTPYLCKYMGSVTRVLGSYQVHVPTPSAYIARAFNYWKGTMCYRFRVIASTFHQGYIKIIYDPLSETLPSLTASGGNVQMTQYLDLSVAREIVVRIPWSSQFPYLEVASQKHTPLNSFTPTLHTSTSNLSGPNFDVNSHNGVISVVIANKLVAPNSQPAYIVVSSWMEDAEFQSPSRRIEADYPMLNATAGLEEDIPVTTEVKLLTDKVEMGMSLVCFGEKVVSLRTLLKRYTMAYINWSVTAASVNFGLVRSVLPQHPVFSEANIVPEGQGVRVSYLTYFSAMYMGRRGATRYIATQHCCVANGTTRLIPITSTITRSWDKNSPGAAGSLLYSGYSFDQCVVTSSSATRVLTAERGRGYEGMALTMETQEPFISYELPYYGGTRFSLARYNSAWTALATTPVTYSMVTNPTELGQQFGILDAESKGVYHYAPIYYVASGEDYSLFWFQSAVPLLVLAGT